MSFSMTKRKLLKVTATGFEHPNIYFVNEHLTVEPIWLNNWAVLWVLICTVNSTICSHHVTCAFQSESALYSCLNVKELLARNRRDIWSLNESNWIWSHKHLVRKRLHNHSRTPFRVNLHYIVAWTSLCQFIVASLAKWLSVCSRTKWLWVRILSKELTFR